MIKRLLAAAFVCGVALPALAATTPNSVITPQTPSRGLAAFLQGTDTADTFKTLYTAGANGSKCVGLVETNNDGSATHLVTVAIFNAAVQYNLTAITTGMGDGTLTGVPPKNVLSLVNMPGMPLDSDGNPFFVLKSGDTLQGTYHTALTSTDSVWLYAICSDY